MIQSGLRRAVAASSAQAGDGDRIINSIPAYRQAGLREMNQESCSQPWYIEIVFIGRTESFLLGRYSLD